MPSQQQINGSTHSELASHIEELKNVAEELRQARRAALNLMEDAILSKEALRQSEEKYRSKLEKEVEERTAEVKATKEILQATLDSSPYEIQAFKSVRNEMGKIIDFTWVMNNRQAVAQNGNVIGKSLLQLNPWMVKAGLFEKFVQVTETGTPLDLEQFYKNEPLDHWFHITVVKMGDGFVMSTEDITEKRRSREEILRLKDEMAQKATDKYLNLFNTMEEGFLIIELIRNQEGKCVNYIYREANPAFDKLVGLKPDAVIGKTVLELFPTLDNWWVKIYADVAEKHQANRFEHFLKENNRWYEVLAYPMPGDQVAILYNDITERKKAEEAIRESEDRKSFLLKVSDGLRSIGDPVEIQEAVTRLTMEHFGADRCYYCEIEDEQSIIRRDAAREGLPSVAGIYSLENIPIVKGVIEAGKPFVVSDITTTELVDVSLRQLCLQLQVISFINIPVIKSGRPVGVFCIVQSKPRAWTGFEVELIEEVAERTWTAVERAKAEQALRESEERKEFLLKLNDTIRQLNHPDEIQYEAARLVAEQLEADKVHFEIVGEDEQLVIHKEYVLGKDPTATGLFNPEEIATALQDSRSEYKEIPDTEVFPLSDEEKAAFAAAKIRSQLSVALNKMGKRVASLAVDQRSPRKWTRLEISILEETAERTWTAVKKAKAEEALRESEALLAKELEDTKQLQKISSRIIEEGDVNALYDALIDSAVEIMHSDFASIQVHVPEAQELLLYAWKGFHPESVAFWKLVSLDSTTSCGKAFRDHARVIVPNVEDWAELSKKDLDEYKRSGVVAMQSTPLMSRAGKVVGMLSTHWKNVYQPSERELSLLDVLARQAADLIERKQAQDELRNSEERFRTLANAVPQVIWGNDAEGKANYFNQRWYDYSGFNYQESVGLGWEAIVHPDDAPASIEKWRAALAKGEVFDTEYRLRRHDGCYRWFIGRNVPLKNEAGNVVGWFGSATDIEDLKKAAEALSQSEVRLRITMESATDYAIITMDTEGRVEKWSSGATQIFGYTEARMIGQPADIIFTEEDRQAGVPQSEIEMARTTGSAADERWHMREDGSRFYASGVLRPIQNNHITGYVKVLRDMTRQQLFTEELHRLVAERTVELQRSNEDLRQFAHVASHDLKEPIRKIQTFNNRILDEYGNVLPPKAKIYSEKIGTAAKRMISMVEGVLFYSKLVNTAQNFEAVNLNEIIEQITIDLEVMMEQKMAQVIKNPLPTIRANPTLIYQLFYNLILNSLKFSLAGEPSRIHISSTSIKQGSQDLLQVVVSDNGIGFEPEYGKDIFKTFTRLHPVDLYEGTGLGLALCKKIVERHGGTISARGELGKGASFTILLPLEMQ
jgi:PAS domain S-box-containing protein